MRFVRNKIGEPYHLAPPCGEIIENDGMSRAIKNNSRTGMTHSQLIDGAPPRGQIIENDDMSQCIIFFEKLQMS